jgi:hypothetical protein
LSFIWCFYTFCLTFGHWTFHGLSKDWAATLVADGARKSCFAACCYFYWTCTICLIPWIVWYRWCQHTRGASMPC